MWNLRKSLIIEEGGGGLVPQNAAIQFPMVHCINHRPHIDPLIDKLQRQIQRTIKHQ